VPFRVRSERGKRKCAEKKRCVTCPRKRHCFRPEGEPSGAMASPSIKSGEKEGSGAALRKRHDHRSWEGTRPKQSASEINWKRGGKENNAFHSRRGGANTAGKNKKPRRRKKRKRSPSQHRRRFMYVHEKCSHQRQKEGDAFRRKKRGGRNDDG